MSFHQLRWTDLEPVVGAWVHLELHMDGWDVRIGHRHRGGAYNDCEPEQYQALSWPEASDVIEATMMTLHGE